MYLGLPGPTFCACARLSFAPATATTMNFTAPHVVPGYEPSMSGPKSDDERAEILSNIKQMRLVQAGIESPVAKAVMSGGMGACRGAVSDCL